MRNDVDKLELLKSALKEEGVEYDDVCPKSGGHDETYSVDLSSSTKTVDVSIPGPDTDSSFLRTHVAISASRVSEAAEKEFSEEFHHNGRNVRLRYGTANSASCAGCGKSVELTIDNGSKGGSEMSVPYDSKPRDGAFSRSKKRLALLARLRRDCDCTETLK